MPCHGAWSSVKTSNHIMVMVDPVVYPWEPDGAAAWPSAGREGAGVARCRRRSQDLDDDYGMTWSGWRAASW